MKSDRPGITPSVFGKHTFLIIAAILTYIPFYLMLNISFKSLPQFYHNVWLPDFPLHLENYSAAWNVVSRYIVNSIFVSSLTILGVVLVGSMAAFAFARFKFPGREILFYMIIVLLMVPFILTMVPAFVWIKNLGLLNTPWGLILPSIAGQQVFAIFILRTFMATLPQELFEAAQLDGANLFGLYWHVAIPLSRPVLSVVVITTLITSWNDFVWPLLVISSDSLRTVPIGLAFFQNQFQTNYGPQMAGFVLASLPLIVVFAVAMRQFVQGLTAGAIKM